MNIYDLLLQWNQAWRFPHVITLCCVSNTLQTIGWSWVFFQDIVRHFCLNLIFWLEKNLLWLIVEWSVKSGKVDHNACLRTLTNVTVAVAVVRDKKIRTDRLHPIGYINSFLLCMSQWIPIPRTKQGLVRQLSWLVSRGSSGLSNQCKFALLCLNRTKIKRRGLSKALLCHGVGMAIVSFHVRGLKAQR